MVFYLRTLVRALPLLLPLVPALYLERYRLPASITYLVLFFVVEYFAIYRPEKSWEAKRRRILDAFLTQWVDESRYGDTRPEIRINVMLVRWFGLGRRFFQVYEYRMKGWPDSTLHFSVRKGFCGECFGKGGPKTYYVDLRGQPADTIKNTYNLNDEEYKKTAHIRAIACRVLAKEAKRVWRPEVIGYKYLGVLNVDAVDDAGAEFLQQPEVLEKITNFGTLIEAIYE